MKPYFKATWYRWLIVLAVLAVLVGLGYLTDWQLPGGSYR